MPIPAGVVRVSYMGHLPSSEIFNVSHWIQEDVGSEDEASELANDIVGKFNTHLNVFVRSLLPSTAGYDECRVYAYTGGAEAAWTGRKSMAGTTDGTSSAAQMPLQCSLVVSLGTARAGRSGRGRMYLPFISANLTNHQWGESFVTGGVTAFDAYFTSLLQDIPANLGPAIVVSRQGVGSFAEVTQVSIDTRVDIQRRRANSQNATARVTADVG